MSRPSAMIRRTLLALALASLPIAASAQDATVPEQEADAPASTESSQGWTWAVAPYLWATTVKTNLREDAPPAGGETDFSDIISKIDMAFQIHVEGQGDRFGVFGDVTFISLGDEATHPNSTSESNLDVSIVELAGVWNVSPERFEGLDLFAGVRRLGTEADVRIDPTNPAIPTFEPGIDLALTDFMFGARYNATLSERWGATFRLDGSTGDTDGTLNASALLRYRMGNGSLIAGYRYMEVELGEGDRSLDLTLNGPIFAYTFIF